jgi:hypothetical protein
MTEMPLMGLLGGSLYGVAEGENSNLTKKCKVLLSHTINYRQPSVIPTCKHHPPSATPYKEPPSRPISSISVSRTPHCCSHARGNPGPTRARQSLSSSHNHLTVYTG